MKIFKKVKEALLDLLFPKECLGCGKDKIWLCNDCLESLNYLEGFFCPVCEKLSFQGLVHAKNCKEKSLLNGLLIANDWGNEILREAIYAFKYNSIYELAQPLGQLLIKKVKNSPYFLSFISCKSSIILPIPLHKKRVLERGFNQAELLAYEVAKYFNLQVISNILIRRINTKPQVDLKKEKRSKNISDAFDITEESFIKDKNIILIDDVSTTGATLQEAARILKGAGAKEIWGLVLARG